MNGTDPKWHLERTTIAQLEFDGVIDGIDWADDDGEPLECGLENPEACEACQ